MHGPNRRANRTGLMMGPGIRTRRGFRRERSLPLAISSIAADPATDGSCASAPVGDTIGREDGRRRGVGDGLGAIRMQPDAVGLALATSVLAVVIAAFGLVSRVVSGAVAGLSYAIGLAVARGIAEWATSEPSAQTVPTGDPDDAPPGTGRDRLEADDDALDAPAVVLARVVGGRPRLRIECRPAGSI